VLSQHLLAVARRANIQQALLYQIGPSYLPGERLTHHHADVQAMRHTECLELPDSEERLRAFMQEHTEEMRKMRAVRVESVGRQLLATRHLGSSGLQTHPEGFHAWLPLTPAFRSAERRGRLLAANAEKSELSDIQRTMHSLKFPAPAGFPAGLL